MLPYQVRMFEASCRALHPVIDRTQSPYRVSKHNVPYLASAGRQNSSHHRMFNTTCRALRPLMDRTPIITDRVFTASCPTLHPLIDKAQSSATRMFNTVPRLASNDHQNPIIDQPIAQSPRSVLHPLNDITQATHRLFHASCRTSITTLSSCNIDHGTVG